MPPGLELRKTESAWREANRKEDVAFRERVREKDQELRRQETAQATRRASALAAAELCEKGASVDAMLSVASSIEAWIKEA